jgi:hypothetical protein
MPIPQEPTSTHCGQPTLANGPRAQFPRSATNREHLLDGSSMPAPIPTSIGTTIPHRPPEWESMLIGILPPRAEGYSTPTHLHPIQEAIHVVLFRPGTTPDFPLDLIPPRNQYPLFHDLPHDLRAQRDNVEQALAAMYTRRVNGSTWCVPKNLQAEEKRLLHLVNDLNRAMFTIRYQSLDQPPEIPDTMMTSTTPSGLAASNDTDYRLMSSRPMSIPPSLSTSLRDRDTTHSTMNLPPSEQAHTHMSASIPSPTLPTRHKGNHRQPERHPRYYVQRRPITTTVDIAVNAPTATITHYRRSNIQSWCCQQ